MSRKLSAEDWIDAGLAALAKKGFGALKADLLAGELGVSRGSFYWHFADVGAYHAAVLARWRDVTTAAIIRETESLPDGAGRLRSLVRRAFKANASLEVGLRAWAASASEAAAVVAAVDKQRIAYLERLLKEAGVEKARARTRARILYWTYLGSAFSERALSPRQFDLLIDELAAFGQS